MLNWDDEIELSQFEADKARKLAIAPLDNAIAQTEDEIAKLQRLAASPERDALIERNISLRQEWLAIKSERLIELAHFLPHHGRQVVLVRGNALELLLRPLEDHKVIRRNGRVVSFEPSHLACAVTRVFMALNGQLHRGLSFVIEIVRRNQATKREAICTNHIRILATGPSLSRSAASRSRMLAPVGAPPFDC